MDLLQDSPVRELKAMAGIKAPQSHHRGWAGHSWTCTVIAEGLECVATPVLAQVAAQVPECRAIDSMGCATSSE